MNQPEHSTSAPEINRRRFLLNTTMAGAAVAVAAPALAAEPVAATTVELTVDEVIEHHQAGLKAALARKFGEEGWRMWAVGPQGATGPSVFFHEDNTKFIEPGTKKGGAA